MEDKTKTDIKTFSITEEGIKAMFEYEVKLIRRLAIALWIIFLIIVSAILIYLSIAK